MSNRLAGSTSAYLAQHAEQPVEWWPWSDEARDEARRRDVPLFISIGYAACHWCHVMAHESFDDPVIAAFLNEHFVPVKVDREERPDVDALYMASAQIITGHGGWPLSIFALSDGRPFLAGTYFPPVDRHGQPGFGRLLEALADAWVARRGEIEAQADEVTAATQREINPLERLVHVERPDTHAARQRLRDELLAALDPRGGFSGAPKFPRADFVDALSEHSDEASRHAVTVTLDAMVRGGLYDHLDGGFARYSVDSEWHVPHFEKMLCDQALLARAYTRAGRRLGRGDWLDVARDTLDFTRRRLRLAHGYASSLDADADNREGSHATWTLTQLDEALAHAGLGADRDAAIDRWRLNDIAHELGAAVARLHDEAPLRTPEKLEPVRRALMAHRDGRPQPGRDEKIILEWNAMLACAFLDHDEFRDEGLLLLRQLENLCSHGVWFRTDALSARATAVDLAWLIEARLCAFEVSGDDSWWQNAREAASYLMANHWDGPRPTSSDGAQGSGLLTGAHDVNDLPLRPSDLFDGATPAATGMAARAFARLSLIGGDPDAGAVAERLVTLASSVIEGHPRALPTALDAAGFLYDGLEIVVPGDAEEVTAALRSLAVPRSVLVSGRGQSPLLASRSAGQIYLCRRGVCARPVRTIDDFTSLLAEFAP